GRVPERPVPDPLDHHVERAADHHAEDQREEESAHEAERAGREGQADRPEQAVGDERPDHEQVAVGEVDQLDDPVDEGVAERDQPVPATDGLALMTLSNVSVLLTILYSP